MPPWKSEPHPFPITGCGVVIPSDAAGAASKDVNLKLDSHTCKNVQEFLRNHIEQSNHGSRGAQEKKRKINPYKRRHYHERES